MVRFEYRFDRLLSAKLAHTYPVLVPDHHWPVSLAAPVAQEPFAWPAEDDGDPVTMRSSGSPRGQHAFARLDAALANFLQEVQLVA